MSSFVVNPVRQIIATVGLSLVIVMAVFPPWQSAWGSEGYGFIFEPPRHNTLGMRIDRERLVIQWITVLFVTIGLVKVFKRKPNSSPS